MNDALTAGFIGAVTTNALHETIRRTVPDAPRVDLLGMQALAKLIAPIARPPRGRALYVATLAGDLLSNSAYFTAVGFAPRRYVVPSGLLAGALAGLGAVALPGPLGLDEKTTARSASTAWLTVALYAAGGLAAGIALREGRRTDPDASDAP